MAAPTGFTGNNAADSGPLHLASASPRRRDILTTLGIAHTWRGVDIDETPGEGESPQTLVSRLAAAKARTARERGNAAGLILAADTVVALGNRIFGKPTCREEALAMLSQLSGRCHTVVTAIVLTADGSELSALSTSEVRFRQIRPVEARAYWATGEACGKAGGYGIQGRGAVFVESLSGSYSGVVGLPVFETANLLRQAGIEVLPPEPSATGIRQDG